MPDVLRVRRSRQHRKDKLPQDVAEMGEKISGQFIILLLYHHFVIILRLIVLRL